MAIKVNLDQLPKVIEQLTQEFAQKFTAEAATMAIELTPVKTGGLRGSIGVFESNQTDNSGTKDASGTSTKAKVTAQSNGISGFKDVYVTAGADYSQGIEFGTANRPATPFMRPVVDQAQAIANRVAKEI